MLKAAHSAIASILEAMSAEEFAHHARLLETCKLEYGDRIPFVRRQDVKGFAKRKPVWLNRVLQPERVLGAAMAMEAETQAKSIPLSRAYQDTDDENEHAAHDDLKRCGKQGRVHVTVANPCDGRKLDRDDGYGDNHRIIEVGN